MSPSEEHAHRPFERESHLRWFVQPDFGDVRILTDFAAAAERHGWDGVHLWDHVLYHRAWLAGHQFHGCRSAIAATTSRIRIVLTVVLPRRQVQEIAQDTAAIDALSGRRLTLLATVGWMDREYTAFGLDCDLRARGRALDERLDRLTELAPAQRAGGQAILVPRLLPIKLLSGLGILCRQCGTRASPESCGVGIVGPAAPVMSLGHSERSVVAAA